MNPWEETTSALNLPNASLITHSEAWYGESDWQENLHEIAEYFHAPPTRPNEEQSIQSALEFIPQHTMMAGHEFDIRDTTEMGDLTTGAIVDSSQDDHLQSCSPSTSGPSLTRKISCPNPPCAGTFVRRGQLDRHLRCTCKFNNRSKTRVVCDACGKSYSRRDAMLRHSSEWHA